MSTKKKKSLSSVISIIASLFLSIFISILAVFVGLKLGFASNSSITKAMIDSKYYHIVYEQFISESESLLIPKGLDISIYEGVFTENQLKTDGNAYLLAALNSKTYSINMDEYKRNLADNIKAYVEENNLMVDGEMDAVIDEITTEIMDYYTDIIRVPYASTIGNVFRAIDKLFFIVCIPVLIFAAIIVWIICRQNLSKKNRIFRYSAYATMSGAISVLIIPIFCMVTEFYKKIQINPEYIYRFMVSYIENGINILLIIGGVLFAVSLIMIGTSTYIKHKYIIEAKERYKRHHREEIE